MEPTHIIIFKVPYAPEATTITYYGKEYFDRALRTMKKQGWVILFVGKIKEIKQ